MQLALVSTRPRDVGRALAIGAAAVGVEMMRGLIERAPGMALPALAAGGLALCAFAFWVPPSRLGLGWRRLGWRLAAGVAIGAVLLLPAAARGASLPGLPLELAVPATLVAAGEEVAFRGALYVALEDAFGPAAAIAGSTFAFVLAHVLTHPPSFLLPVAALGVLLGLWRWSTRDLVAPIVAHVLADLAL